jgi:hypothetical protein
MMAFVVPYKRTRLFCRIARGKARHEELEAADDILNPARNQAKWKPELGVAPSSIFKVLKSVKSPFAPAARMEELQQSCHSNV